MDQRLIPVNGLIALIRGDGRWPRPLGEQGWQRHQFEALVTTSLGDFRADAVLYRRSPDLVLLAECKSGRNIAEEQARRYVVADAEALQRAGTLPRELRATPAVPVAVLFVGREEERAELDAALKHLRITAPLLTVGPQRVRLSGASAVAGLDDFDIPHNGGQPPARFPVDHQSPPSEIRELVLPRLVAAQARGDEFLGIESVCEAILPEWPVLALGARQNFIKRTEGVVLDLVRSRLKSDFRYEHRTGSAQGRVVVLRSPAAFDPRGATRAWQARQSRAADALGRGPRPPAFEGQLSLEDLAAEGGLADE